MPDAISIQGLTKTYGNGFQALKGIDLTIQRGDFFALLGPNGAGKSTTIGILCSLVRKSAGRVSIFGHDIDKNFASARQQVGVVSQEFNFSPFEKVFDIVATQGGYYGLNRAVARERAQHYMKKLDLWDKRDSSARMLSGGMKRRLMIARALIHEPPLLILDEPTAGVDIELRRSMWDFLREINQQGTTIVLTTHYLEEAESLCRNIAIINQGQIIENTSMKNLLRQLNQETYLLDLAQATNTSPILDTRAQLIDPLTLEVDLTKGENLNRVFEQLSAQGIVVNGMRNKTNRLETLFVELVQKPHLGVNA